MWDVLQWRFARLARLLVQRHTSHSNEVLPFDPFFFWKGGNELPRTGTMGEVPRNSIHTEIILLHEGMNKLIRIQTMYIVFPRHHACNDSSMKILNVLICAHWVWL